MKKPATVQETKWMNRIAQLPCVVCGNEPVEIHHIVQGGRLGHMWTLPLCYPCHRPVLTKKLNNYGDQMAYYERMCRSIGFEPLIPETKVVKRRDR